MPFLFSDKYTCATGLALRIDNIGRNPVRVHKPLHQRDEVATAFAATSLCVALFLPRALDFDELSEIEFIHPRAPNQARPLGY
jgi:hypothetical protein